MMKKIWFIIKTKPLYEKKVAKQFFASGIEYYLPIHRQLRQWHDRKKIIEQPLFSTYIFVYTTEKLRQQAFGASGVIKYLFMDGKIATLTEKEIERIKILCTLEETKIEESQHFAPGDEVEIISGKLKGLKGQLLETEKAQKLKIYFKSLGCFATISIDKNQVMKISKVA